MGNRHFLQLPPILLILALAAAACNFPSSSRSPTPLPVTTQPPAVPTATQPPATARPTHTSSPLPSIIPTQPPTRTPRPSKTPSPRRTPWANLDYGPVAHPDPRVSINTPFPIPDLNVQYRLVDWTPERAEALIDKMILYPNGLEWVRPTLLGQRVRLGIRLRRYG